MVTPFTDVLSRHARRGSVSCAPCSFLIAGFGSGNVVDRFGEVRLTGESPPVVLWPVSEGSAAVVA